VLAGVVDQVAHHHPQRLGVAADRPGLVGHAQLGLPHRLGELPVGDHLGDHVRHRHLLGPQHRAAVGHEGARLQELLHHVAQALALGDDAPEDLLAVGGGRHLGAADQRLGHPEDHRDRRAQLVADHRQELVLEPVDLLEARHRGGEGGVLGLQLAGAVERRLVQRPQVPHDRPGDRRRQPRLALHGGRERLQHRGRHVALEHVAAGAGGHHLADVGLVGVGGVGDHRHLGPAAHDLPGGGHPALAGHAAVHQHHVGGDLLDQRHRRLAGLGLADDLPAADLLQHRAQHAADRRVVVDQQDPAGTVGALGGRLHVSSIGTSGGR
jgi:hypothetical protein